MEKFTTMEKYGLRVCGKSSNARGPKAADKLNLSHHSLLQKDASFRDAADSLVQADQQLNGGASGAAIWKIFVRRRSVTSRIRLAGVGVRAESGGKDLSFMQTATRISRSHRSPQGGSYGTQF